MGWSSRGVGAQQLTRDGGRGGGSPDGLGKGARRGGPARRGQPGPNGRGRPGRGAGGEETPHCMIGRCWRRGSKRRAAHHSPCAAAGTTAHASARWRRVLVSQGTMENGTHCQKEKERKRETKKPSRERRESREARVVQAGSEGGVQRPPPSTRRLAGRPAGPPPRALPQRSPRCALLLEDLPSLPLLFRLWVAVDVVVVAGLPWWLVWFGLVWSCGEEVGVVHVGARVHRLWRTDSDGGPAGGDAWWRAAHARTLGQAVRSEQAAKGRRQRTRVRRASGCAEQQRRQQL